MGKTSERLKGYQTQMSIYAEQHKIILASDVLDMIEQLQDDLKDDTDAVVAEFEKKGTWHSSICNDDIYSPLQKITVGEAIDIVRKGGV